MYKYRFINDIGDIDSMLQCNSTHCINSLLPSTKNIVYAFRGREFHFEVPTWQSSLFCHPFVVRFLYLNLLQQSVFELFRFSFLICKLLGKINMIVVVDMSNSLLMQLRSILSAVYCITV